MATGSVADTTALLASWCERAPKGLAVVEFDSEPARQRVVEDLRSRLAAAGVPFDEMALSDDDGPRELIAQLSAFATGAVSISGFEALFPVDGSHAEMLASFNFQRENLAAPALCQIWWVSTRVAKELLLSAPDLYSWFIVRLHLSEVIASPKPSSPIELRSSERRKELTSTNDARQRAAELARRFERALDDPGKPLPELAHQLMEPAVRALSEVGAEREARELESDLRQRAQAKGRPLPPRIFISYSHDSPKHAARVLALANRLREEGVDAQLDQYESSPAEGWPRWMRSRIAEADFVLVVGSKTYEQRFDGNQAAGRGLGAQWEGAILTQELYEAAVKNTRFIPVVLSHRDVEYIPIVLRAATRYDLDSSDGYERLYRRLVGQPETVKPSLGKLRKLAPRSQRQDFAGGRQLWNVPHRHNPFFTGREDLLVALDKALTKDGPAALGQTQAISGLGGIGKTQIAVEYAYRHRNKYRAVLWCRAGTEADLAAGFQEIARMLELPDGEIREQAKAVASVRQWLEREAGWLLVLDNADDPETVARFLPAAHRGHVLLTSRAWNLNRLKVVRPFRLKPLERGESVRFLLKRTVRDEAVEAEKEVASEVAEELGDLPLALEQAAAYIYDRQTRFDAYLASYRERRLRLLELGEPADYPASVATTWALNFEEVEKTSAASAELLRLSVFLAPDAIPLELLAKGGSELGSELSKGLANVNEDPLALDELLAPLARFSLIERDIEKQTYRIHRLVQAVLKDALDGTERRLWAERTVRAMNKAFPDPDLENWPLCERLQPQALAVALLIEAYSFDFEEAGQLLNDTGLFASQRARYPDGERLFQRSITIMEEAIGPRHPDLAKVLNNLAGTYFHQGRFSEAEPLYRRSLEIFEVELGSEHLDVATALNNLAEVYHSQGRLSEAEQLFQRSLVIKEKSLGPDHPSLATTLNNLAGVYYAQGRLLEAEPLMRRDLAITERELGPEHPAVAIGLNNLAYLYHKQARFAESEELYQRALVILEQSTGQNHPRFARTLSNLANLFWHQDRYSEAEPLYRRSLAIREKILRDGHPDIVASLQSLAILLRKTDREEEALEVETRAKRIHNEQQEEDKDAG